MPGFRLGSTNKCFFVRNQTTQSFDLAVCTLCADRTLKCASQGFQSPLTALNERRIPAPLDVVLSLRHQDLPVSTHNFDFNGPTCMRTLGNVIHWTCLRFYLSAVEQLRLCPLKVRDRPTVHNDNFVDLRFIESRVGSQSL